MSVGRGGRAVALLASALVGGCAPLFQSSGGAATRAATDDGAPAIMQATVPFAILLVIGLVISRTFKSD